MNHHSDFPSHCSHDFHIPYHVDYSWHPSWWRSYSSSHDCHHEDHHECHSSDSCYNSHFDVHHDFPSNAKFLADNALKLINHPSTPLVYALKLNQHLTTLTIWNMAHQSSQKLISSNTFWLTQMSRTTFSQIWWTTFSKKSEPITELGYHSSNDSYVGYKPARALSPPFDICNYTSQKTKEYRCWYHAKSDKHPCEVDVQQSCSILLHRSCFPCQREQHTTPPKHDCRCYKFL